MSERSGIIAGGNWIIDRVKLIDLWPPQDSLACVLGQSASNGGSPYNLLKDLARLGADFPLEAIGLIGDDADGRSIREDCHAHGITTHALHSTTAAPTSSTDVMTVVSTGRRTFFHQRGTNALLGPGHFDFSTTGAKIFHLGYLLLLDELDRPGPDGLPRAAEVLRRAQAAGLRTSLVCFSEASDRFSSVVVPVLPWVDILFANDFEAEKLTGISFGTEGRPALAVLQRATAALLAAGVREWAIIHFPAGVVAAGRNGQFHWQARVRVPEDQIAGTAGAGDALAAGVLFGLHEAWSMPQALELGVCAAAASLAHPTCSESIQRVEACLARGRQFGFADDLAP